MYDIREFSLENYTIRFINHWRKTRSGFAHDTSLYINGRPICDATCNYLNRTWEWYRYQTVMLEAAQKAGDDLYKRELPYFKRKNQYDKLTAKRKQEFESYLNTLADYQLYTNIKNYLKGRVI